MGSSVESVGCARRLVGNHHEMVEQLLLATEKVHKVQVRPLVVFQILDRFLRRHEDQERVIGTLLGTVVNGVVEITNSFPVPHLEKGDEVAIGKDYHKQMHFLHSRINSTETIIGWYATSDDSGALLNDHSCLIHDFYASECDAPVHVVVDTSLNQDQVQVKAFTSSALSLVDCALTNQFQQIQVETQVLEAESIALDIMAQNRTGGFTLESTGSSRVPSDLETLETSIEKLQEMINTCHAYVQDVLSGGRIEGGGDPTIGRAIAKALQSVPELCGDKFDKIFNNSLQDLLMVNYLSTLTQTQLSLSEKLLLSETKHT